MSYTDDTQLYVLIKPSDRTSKLFKLEDGIRDIRAWLTENKLMLNDTKTEILLVKFRYARIRIVPKNVSITIGNATISPSPKVRDLGMVFDDDFMMNSHVNDICRRASFAIHKIGKPRRYLDSDNAEKLVHAFIT